jgi:hypothetical protein
MAVVVTFVVVAVVGALAWWYVGRDDETGPTVGETVPALAPTISFAEPGVDTVTLTWLPGEQGDATVAGYSVEYRGTGLDPWDDRGAAVPDAGGQAPSKHTVRGLGSNTAYEFRMGKEMETGLILWSEPVECTTLLDAPDITNLSFDIDDEVIVRVNWNKSGDDDAVDEYAVRYGPEGGFQNKRVQWDGGGETEFRFGLVKYNEGNDFRPTGATYVLRAVKERGADTVATSEEVRIRFARRGLEQLCVDGVGCYDDGVCEGGVCG